MRPCPVALHYPLLFQSIIRSSFSSGLRIEPSIYINDFQGRFVTHFFDFFSKMPFILCFAQISELHLLNITNEICLLM